MDTITDISTHTVSPQYLREAALGRKGLHRYSVDQVLTFFSEVALPTHVMRYNEYAAAVRDPNVHAEHPWVSMLDPDYKNVSTADIRTQAMESITALVEGYQRLSPGELYTHTSRPFKDTVTFDEVQREGSPMQWIGMKQHEGFVARSLWNFPYGGLDYDPNGNSQMRRLPDREIALHWGLEGGALLYMSPAATYWSESQHLDASGLHTLLTENARMWKRLVPQVVRGSVAADIEAIRADTSLAEMSESHDMQFSSWSAVEALFLEDRVESKLRFQLMSTRAVCRDIGFVPFVDKITGVDELHDFVIAFLRREYLGPAYSEATYRTVLQEQQKRLVRR
jgi:hypothetical protein